MKSLVLLLALAACSSTKEGPKAAADEVDPPVATQEKEEATGEPEPSVEEPTDPEPDATPAEEAVPEDPPEVHIDLIPGPDVTGLVFLLLDRDHHEEECKGTAWEQPSIDDYRADPKSHLPESCPLPPEKYPSPKALYFAEE